jgi:hypothetical protein
LNRRERISRHTDNRSAISQPASVDADTFTADAEDVDQLDADASEGDDPGADEAAVMESSGDGIGDAPALCWLAPIVHRSS